ncbi:hypothetical protein PXD56_04480 [Maribacter sp. SA7]|uniref:hypothetical protein n=1 Tax=Maribacter zhoushanensis TaxID=3030012 RepID=UPI0023ED6850|nr:hypothetical protein [Maribacter zhoushanensis]MDF4202195.1 hypothetical protein [Maribacter zhoushanensis]
MQKEVLQILEKIGEKKIELLKTSYELTESELLLIIKLHYRGRHLKNKKINNILDIF